MSKSPNRARVSAIGGIPFSRTLCSLVVASALAIMASVVDAQPMASHAHPAQAAHSNAATLEQRVANASNGLLQSLKAFERGNANERAQRANDVIQRATERRQALLALIETDPTRVMALSMPPALRDKMPAGARALIEETVEAEGRVVGMLIDDIERGTSEHPLFLETDAPAARVRYGLHWADRSLTEAQMMALIDKRVRVRALRVADQLVIGDRSQIEMAMAGGSTGGGSTTMAMSTTPLVSGDQRTLVILSNFSDKTVPCSASDVNTRLFGSTTSVDQILRQSSRDAVTFSGRVVGPVTIPYSSTGTCDYKAWGTAVDAAAKAAGVDMSGYARISYALPSNGNCGFSGIANLGGTQPTRSWILYCSNTGVFAHELGHNLRFHHASTPSSEYGDYSDPMGYVRTVQMNAANRVMAGWLGSGNVVDAASSGTYTIATLAAPDTGAAQVLRLRKADTNEYYYLSLRQSLELDANLNTADKNVVSVHRATGALPSKTVLMARLAPGQTFSDAANGIGVTAQSIVTGMASVSLQMAGPVCAKVPPSISVSPSSQTGSPGATLAYSVSVKNNNSTACSSSSFAMAQALPSGFGGSFSTSSVALAPGASASLRWSVASSGSSADGVYAMRATAAEAGAAGTSASAGYTVYSDASPPTVNVSYPSNGAVLSSKPVSLAASAYDAGGVARVEFRVSGALVGTSTSAPYQVRWNPRKAKGQQTVTARAIDTDGNVAEDSVAVTVQ